MENIWIPSPLGLDRHPPALQDAQPVHTGHTCRLVPEATSLLALFSFWPEHPLEETMENRLGEPIPKGIAFDKHRDCLGWAGAVQAFDLEKIKIK